MLLMLLLLLVLLLLTLLLLTLLLLDGWAGRMVDGRKRMATMPHVVFSNLIQSSPAGPVRPGIEPRIEPAIEPKPQIDLKHHSPQRGIPPSGHQHALRREADRYISRCPFPPANSAPTLLICNLPIERLNLRSSTNRQRAKSQKHNA